ncbi:NAD(P)/FAD-dependent oxidoreductase [Candidatus Heimdallarchaeota archaeon]|nr:MAG: NAD(P)/FAD-dependent oxidoreductase [Candidatus Heimdallarchaeota archaeon]
MKTILILGGGFSGINTANKIAKKSKRKDVRIILVEPKEHNVYEPHYLFWSFNKDPLKKFTIPIDKVLNRRVQHIRAAATFIDTKSKTVDLTNGDTLFYDYLVLSTGVRLAEEKVGAYDKDNVHHFYSTKATKELQEAMRNFQGGTIVISPATVPYKCPPAPVEFAFLVDRYFRKRKMRDKVTIKFLYPLLRPYPVPSVAEKVQKLYDKRGIEFIEFFNYESVDKENNKIISMEGDEIQYDLLVLIPPHEGQKVIIDSGLGDREGFVPTDRFTLKVKDHENIYAIGDGTNLPVSKSGAVSHFSAPALAKNLLAELEGKPAKYKYNGFTICFVVTSPRRSMLLYFSYDYPPKKFGLHNLFIYGLFKKAFKIAYFHALLRGYL